MSRSEDLAGGINKGERRNVQLVFMYRRSGGEWDIGDKLGCDTFMCETTEVGFDKRREIVMHMHVVGQRGAVRS